MFLCWQQLLKSAFHSSVSPAVLHPHIFYVCVCRCCCCCCTSSWSSWENTGVVECKKNGLLLISVWISAHRPSRRWILFPNILDQRCCWHNDLSPKLSSLSFVCTLAIQMERFLNPLGVIWVDPSDKKVHWKNLEVWEAKLGVYLTHSRWQIKAVFDWLGQVAGVWGSSLNLEKGSSDVSRSA